MQRWDPHNGDCQTGERLERETSGFHTKSKLYKSFATSVRHGHSWLWQEKASTHSNTNVWGRSSSPTGSRNPMSVYGAKPQILCADKNLFSPLLSVRRYCLATSHAITATRDQHARATDEDGRKPGRQRNSWSDHIKYLIDMTMPELLRPTGKIWSLFCLPIGPPDDWSSLGTDEDDDDDNDVDW